MASVWFAIVGLLIAAYVVLDGFDLGAGVIHRFVARSDRERRSVFDAIGPFWDGNEVFLLATGGALFVAFPAVVARAISGLYLGVMMVLWALILRGVSIELRSHLADSLWRSFWDMLFQLASGVLALLLGVTLGNVLRGFPMDSDGYFELELFSIHSPLTADGVIDGYTLATGLFGLVVLVVHGARFLVLRTEGEVRERAERIAKRFTPVAGVGWIVVTALSWFFARDAVAPAATRPLAIGVALLAAGSFSASAWLGARRDPRGAFLTWAAFIVALIALAGAVSYPVLLRSTNPIVASLTAESAASGASSMSAGLSWWPLAAVLVAVYFANLYRVHRGGTTPYGEGGEVGDESDPSQT